MLLDSEMSLRLGDYKIALDTGKTDICFVSHAHSDHTRGVRRNSKTIIASPETLALAGVSDPNKLEKNTLAGYGLKLLPSGHVLGSRQLRVEGDGKVFTYTGDFKLDDSLTAKKAVVKETDYLLLEGTYGNPHVAFPSRKETYEEIASWARKHYENGEIVVLGGYALGKAQELIACLNKYAGITPVVTERIAEVSATYNDFGSGLKFIKTDTQEAQEEMKGGFVSVIPQNKVNWELAVNLSKLYKKSVYTGVATGWATRVRFPVDKAFPLSDHADFEQILEYIERADPRRVYCTHGNDERLALELKKLGVNAVPAKQAAQMVLEVK